MPGPLELKGMDGAAPRLARRGRARRARRARSGPRAPLVGRETPSSSCSRTPSPARVRDGRAHLFTIYGEPGVGKSRLAREFVDGVERASVLIGPLRSRTARA